MFRRRSSARAMMERRGWRRDRMSKKTFLMKVLGLTTWTKNVGKRPAIVWLLATIWLRLKTERIPYPATTQV